MWFMNMVTSANEVDRAKVTQITEVSMRNTIKLFGIIALAAIIGFSMTACKTGPESKSEPISIIITGINSSTLNGWEAYLALGDDAFAMPLSITASTTSLTFTMLNMSNNKSFIKLGDYMVVLWFKKGGEADKNYVIVSKRINEGSNTISFSDFTSL
jgi:hypothetical protein